MLLLKLRAKVVTVLILVFCLTGCRNLEGHPVSEGLQLEAESMTGIVVGVTQNSVTVDVSGKLSEFSTTKMTENMLEITAVGDMITINYEANQPKDATDIEVIERAKPQKSSFEIYDIKGSAEAISGEKWDKMLAHRNKLKDYAKEYRDLVVLNINPSNNTVYLTFDDGPDPLNTVKIMNTLMEYKVNATFFFTGENMRKYPSIVKKAHDNNFIIGLHGYDHKSLITLNEAQIADQLNQSNKVLEDITGERTNLMRPPYGALNPDTINAIGDMGQIAFIWSLDTLDWAQKDKNEILRNIKENLRPGDIILMHSTSNQDLTAEILPEIVEYIQSQGYEIAGLK